MITVNFRNKEYKITFGEYTNSGNYAIKLRDIEDDQPYIVATVNLELRDKTVVAIKNYSENLGILQSLLKADLIEYPHIWKPSGFEIIPICKLTQKSLNAIEKMFEELHKGG